MLTNLSVNMPAILLNENPHNPPPEEVNHVFNVMETLLIEINHAIDLQRVTELTYFEYIHELKQSAQALFFLTMFKNYASKELLAIYQGLFIETHTLAEVLNMSSDPHGLLTEVVSQINQIQKILLILIVNQQRQLGIND